MVFGIKSEELNCEPINNKTFLKTKIRSYGDEMRQLS